MVNTRIALRQQGWHLLIGLLTAALLAAACTPTATPPAIPPATATPTEIQPSATLVPPTSTATAPTLRPTSTQTASPTETEEPAGADLQLLSAANVAALERIEIESQFKAQALGWLPSSDTLALANQNAVQLLSLAEAQELPVTEGASNPTTLSISPTGSRIAIARLDNQIELLDPTDASRSIGLPGHMGAITSLAFSADGRWLASAATDNTVRIWEAENGSLLGGWQLTYWVTGLTFSPDGSRLAGVDLPAFSLHLWEIGGLALDTALPPENPLGDPPPEQVLTWAQETIPALYQASLSPDWSQVAWVARGTIQLMQLPGGELGPTFEHEDFVNGVAWSPDGNLLASAAAATVEDQFNPATLMWDPQAGNLISTLILPEAASGVYFSPDGKMLAILDAEGEVQLWAAPR